MQGKRIFASKSFSTSLTQVFFIQYEVRIMCHHMLSKGMFVWTQSPTDTAHMLTSKVVNVCVPLQLEIGMKSLVTDFTSKPVFTQVPPSVYTEVG
jgi:hypothetical protein